jgi:hypothetical protein
MHVEYDVSLDDLLHFQRYHWKHSPALQRQYRLGFIPAPALGLLAAVGLVGLEPRLLWVAVFLATAAIYAAVYVWCVGRSFRSTLSAALAEGKNRGVLGRHEIELRVEGLREATDVNDTTHAWRGIERIEADERFIFIYTQAMMAHAIPRRAFSSPEDAERFLAMAREKHAASAA